MKKKSKQAEAGDSKIEFGKVKLKVATSFKKNDTATEQEVNLPLIKYKVKPKVKMNGEAEKNGKGEKDGEVDITAKYKQKFENVVENKGWKFENEEG